MQGMIGDYEFKLNKNSYQKLKDSYSFGWSKKERLYANPIFMKKNKSSHKIDIDGMLIMQHVDELEGLIAIAEKKEPVTFVTLDHARVIRVTIHSITIDKDIFLEGGAEVRKKFSMSMERFYGN